jgi:hypothetical protein
MPVLWWPGYQTRGAIREAEAADATALKSGVSAGSITIG